MTFQHENSIAQLKQRIGKKDPFEKVSKVDTNDDDGKAWACKSRNILDSFKCIAKKRNEEQKQLAWCPF